MKLICTSVVLAAATMEKPISKVVRLLKDMRHQLDNEQSEDQKLYDKMKCWCNTNGEEKTQAISIANKRISSLDAMVQEKIAHAAELHTEINKLGEEIAKNTGALNQATSNRDKASAEFHDEEKDLIQSIDALKNAIVVLGKHHDNPTAGLMSVQSLLKQALGKHKDILDDMMPSNRGVVSSFLQQPAHFKSYAPQSGQIFGILKQMKEQFEKNLANARKNDMADQESYSQLKQAKEEEIAAGKDQVETKESDLADTNEDLANGKSDLEDTAAALAADQAFLADLTAKCAATDKEFQERSKERADEIAAVGEAISILNDPDSFDLFGKTTTQKSMRTQQDGFLQLGAEVVRTRARNSAVAQLQAVAEKTGSSQVAALALKAKLDDFVKVKAAIDKMVAELTKQQEEEIAKKDYCVEAINKNEKEIALGTQNQEYLQSKSNQLESNIKTLTEEIEAAQAEIKETKIQIKRAGEDRAAANNDFQTTVADQRETQTILKKVVERLEQYYVEKVGPQVFAQEDPVPGAAAPPPPPGFKEYKKNEGGNKIIAMINNVIHESQQVENEAIQSEKDAQAQYEGFVQDSNRAVAALEKSISDNKAERADDSSELSSVKGDLKQQGDELEALAGLKADVHKDCDFLLENFDIRQDTRAEEIEGLKEAKAALSGAV
mmetsp:Transcript_15342/g.33846  ORF Transcript_15342/g.33846 Transcript_15342/m.33846 type:complete len:666 (+) Transcript_15342:80-2077(+)